MPRPPDPVLVVDLFPRERTALLELLDALGPDDWAAPLASGDWTVKDVVGHLVGDDLGRLARGRDEWLGADDETGGSPKERVDRRNAEWVAGMRPLSPAVLRSLLVWSGTETQSFFASLDPFALGGTVSWAGARPAPVWLDLARELTERWHHQQQIRDAARRRLLDDPDLLRAVLATFAHALPVALAGVRRAEGATAVLVVTGPRGGTWTVRSEKEGWRLLVGADDARAATVVMDEETAWRMYVASWPPNEIARRATIEGDAELATRLLRAFALVS
jgi:uncharacterized protein (TIGR03083 family)